jgi:hypothetical protein
VTGKVIEIQTSKQSHDLPARRRALDLLGSTLERLEQASHSGRMLFR